MQLRVAMSWVQSVLEDPRLVWVMSYVMILTAIVTMMALTFISAPYGRYSDKKWGLLLNARLAWFVQELPSFLLPLVLMAVYGLPWRREPRFILLCLFVSHYFQRTFIFSLLIKGGKPTPFVPFFLAMIFTAYNGLMQGLYFILHAEYEPHWLRDPRFIIGVALFFIGMLTNIHSDYILRNLRKPGETSYKIPHGGMFEFVSGANFFGESLEWLGFALASWSLPSLAFAVFTVCNIGPRAKDHHRWYREKFEDYPADRKAFIPFIF